MVLFRASIGVQPDFRSTVPYTPGISWSSSRNSNLRLGAVRRLAYEAADCGLLSAEAAAGGRRVKGMKKLGVRLGNWQWLIKQ